MTFDRKEIGALRASLTRRVVSSGPVAGPSAGFQHGIFYRKVRMKWHLDRFHDSDGLPRYSSGHWVAFGGDIHRLSFPSQPFSILLFKLRRLFFILFSLSVAVA